MVLSLVLTVPTLPSPVYGLQFSISSINGWLIINHVLAKCWDHSISPHCHLFWGRGNRLRDGIIGLWAISSAREGTDPFATHPGQERISVDTSSIVSSVLPWLKLRRTLLSNGSSPALQGTPFDHRFVGSDLSKMSRFVSSLYLESICSRSLQANISGHLFVLWRVPSYQFTKNMISIIRLSSGSILGFHAWRWAYWQLQKLLCFCPHWKLAAFLVTL